LVPQSIALEKILPWLGLLMTLNLETLKLAECDAPMQMISEFVLNPFFDSKMYEQKFSYKTKFKHLALKFFSVSSQFILPSSRGSTKGS